MTLSSLNSLIIILICGSLLLLSFLSFVNPLKANNKANFWLGIFFLLWSTFWVEEISELIKFSNFNDLIVLTLRFFQFFTSLVFYFTVVFFTNPDFKFSKKEFKHLVLPAIYVGFSLLNYYNLFPGDNSIELLLVLLIFVQAILYIIISYSKIRKHQKRILIFSSDTDEINLNWLEYVIKLMIFIIVTLMLYNLLKGFAPPNGLVNLIFLIIIYGVAYFSLKQKEIYPVGKKQRIQLIKIDKNNTSKGVKRKVISDTDLDVFKFQLNELMQYQKPYLESDLNLIKLSDLLNITPHQLSYVINTGFNQNFFEFINKYRVEKAKRMLLSSKKENLSILGIAFESGFNSKTSFNTTFKKMTNLTPSEFKKRGSNL